MNQDTEYIEPGHPDSNERCPVCASHGVVSIMRAIEASPGIYEHRSGQGPCPRCVRLGYVRPDYGIM
jgi:hypothetical protein